MEIYVLVQSISATGGTSLNRKNYWPIYIEFFEKLALEFAPTNCPIEEIYVDDTFCIVKRGTEEDIFSHLNNIRSTIKFTLELERDDQLSFLDILLHRREEDGMLDSKVYREE